MTEEAAKPEFKKLPTWVVIVITLVLTAAIYLIPQLLTGIALVLGMAITGASEAATNAWLGGTTGSFVVSLLSYGLMPIVMWIALRRLRERWQDYGVRGVPLAKLLSYASVGFVVYYGALILAMIAVGLSGLVDLTQEQQIGFDRQTSGAALALVFAALVVLPATVEELLFRGFLFGRLRRVLSFGWTTLLVSIIFGLLHLQLGAGAPPLWSVMIDTAILSVVLCYVRERTGSIWAGVLIHAAKNTIAFVALFLL